MRAQPTPLPPPPTHTHENTHAAHQPARRVLPAHAGRCSSRDAVGCASCARAGRAFANPPLPTPRAPHTPPIQPPPVAGTGLQGALYFQAWDPATSAVWWTLAQGGRFGILPGARVWVGGGVSAGGVSVGWWAVAMRARACADVALALHPHAPARHGCCTPNPVAPTGDSTYDLILAFTQGVLAQQDATATFACPPSLAGLPAVFPPAPACPRGWEGPACDVDIDEVRQAGVAQRAQRAWVPLPAAATHGVRPSLPRRTSLLGLVPPQRSARTCTHAHPPPSPPHTHTYMQCARGLDDCDAHAACSNTPGRWRCACHQTYLGDGRTCVANRLAQELLQERFTTDDMGVGGWGARFCCLADAYPLPHTRPLNCPHTRSQRLPLQPRRPLPRRRPRVGARPHRPLWRVRQQGERDAAGLPGAPRMG